jgi:hypothetical protein
VADDGPRRRRGLGRGPDGNTLAFFVRRERGRELLLLNALDGKIEAMVPMPGIDQQLNPAFSPDGTKLAFHGVQGGHADIFLYDLQAKTIANLTQDDAFDFAPTFSPDGKWIYYSGVQGTTAKIFRFQPGVQGSREQITYGDWNDEDATVSPDGKRLYFTSDRDGGIYNIYSINLDNGETTLFTNVVGGCFSPAVLVARDGSERLVFSAYYKRRFTLYVTDAKKPYRKLADVNPAPSPAGATTIAPYQPPIEVAIDPEKITKKPSHKLFLENAEILAGISTDQTFLSNTILTFGDNLGDRRLVGVLQTVSSFTNILLQYTDISQRLQKGIEAYDQRQYYLAINSSTGEVVRTRSAYRFTGGDVFGTYPFNRYYRIEGDRGIHLPPVRRLSSLRPGNRRHHRHPDAEQLSTVRRAFRGRHHAVRVLRADLGAQALLRGELVPVHHGHQAAGLERIDADPGFRRGPAALLQDHAPLADRAAALRLPRHGQSPGRARLRRPRHGPGPAVLRHLRQLRRLLQRRVPLPLIDFLATPILGIAGIRGKVFFDVGGAALKNQPFQFWSDYQLCGTGTPLGGAPAGCNGAVGGFSDWGFGLTTDFLGLPLHFDFAKQWNFKESLTGFKLFFYIGPEF